MVLHKTTSLTVLAWWFFLYILLEHDRILTLLTNAVFPYILHVLPTYSLKQHAPVTISPAPGSSSCFVERRETETINKRLSWGVAIQSIACADNRLQKTRQMKHYQNLAR